MPSTSAKQHRFMQAIAHSPSFAKKAGVPQSVGKDFTAADKGKTFKKGGMMKKRRFDEGGEIDYEMDENAEPERKYFAAGVSRKSEMPKAKSFAKPSSKSISDMSDMGAQEAPEDTGAVSGMASRKYKFKGTDADKERNAKNLAKELAATAVLGGAGKVAQSAMRAGRAATAARDAATKYAETPAMRAASKANEARFLSREASARNRLGSKDIEDFKKGGFMKESKAMVGKEVAFMKKKGAPASMIKHEKAEMKGYARGGGIESKGKTRRMADGGATSSTMTQQYGQYGQGAFGGLDAVKQGEGQTRRSLSNIQNELGGQSGGGYKIGDFYKDLYPSAASQSSGMTGGVFKKGGSIRGGGIESRGKTKGTVIKMATGGSVSRRADGIAQRGKTKFKMC
jgi:hypothetical protein